MDDSRACSHALLLKFSVVLLVHARPCKLVQIRTGSLKRDFKNFRSKQCRVYLTGQVFSKYFSAWIKNILTQTVSQAWGYIKVKIFRDTFKCLTLLFIANELNYFFHFISEMKYTSTYIAYVSEYFSKTISIHSKLPGAVIMNY